MDGALPIADIAGVGLNATDTIIRLPYFPALNSKVEFRSSEVLPGGQVASAMAACSAWGLKARRPPRFGPTRNARRPPAPIEAQDAKIPDRSA